MAIVSIIPFLTVIENVEFGLKLRGINKLERNEERWSGWKGLIY